MPYKNKEMQQKHDRVYYFLHREKKLRKMKEWRQNQPDKVHQIQKNWRDKNKKEIKLYSVEWIEKNPEYYKKWRNENRNQIKEWKIENRAKLSCYRKRRRAFKKGAEGSHTLEEWLKLKERFLSICLSCRKKEPFFDLSYPFLTEDHVIPLVKGGSDYIENIQPLCIKCNDSKGIKSTDFRRVHFSGERNIHNK